MPPKPRVDAHGAILNAAELTVDEVVGKHVHCPACANKAFLHWPFGWDAHSASVCPGVTGDTEKKRKYNYKSRFLHLFKDKDLSRYRD